MRTRHHCFYCPSYPTSQNHLLLENSVSLTGPDWSYLGDREKHSGKYVKHMGTTTLCRIFLYHCVEHSLSWQHVNSRDVQHGPLPTANLPLSSLLQSHSFVSSLLGCISLLVKLLLPFLGLLTGLLTLVSTCKSRMKNVKTSPLPPEVFYLLCVIALVTLKVVPTWSSDSGFNHDAGFSVTSTHLHQCTAINSLNLRCKKYVQ